MGREFPFPQDFCGNSHGEPHVDPHMDIHMGIPTGENQIFILIPIPWVWGSIWGYQYGSPYSWNCVENRNMTFPCGDPHMDIHVDIHMGISIWGYPYGDIHMGISIWGSPQEKIIFPSHSHGYGDSDTQGTLACEVLMRDELFREAVVPFFKSSCIERKR